LKEARNGATLSQDHELKDKLSDIYDSVLELKEVIANLRTENEDLKTKLHTKHALTWDTEHKLYFAKDDPDPFCPAYVERDGKQMRLQPAYSGGEPFRLDCKICGSFYLTSR
jgi:uncharacterized small protein (DUF1192 family)